MPKRKLSDADAELIRTFLAAKVSPAALAREYGCSVSNVTLIRDGKIHTGKKIRRSDRTLSDDDVRTIRRLRAEGLTERAIGSAFPSPVGAGTVHQILAGKTYQDVA